MVKKKDLYSRRLVRSKTTILKLNEIYGKQYELTFQRTVAGVEELASVLVSHDEGRWFESGQSRPQSPQYLAPSGPGEGEATRHDANNISFSSAP